jgi:LPS-assembly lipoprotein
MVDASRRSGARLPVNWRMMLIKPSGIKLRPAGATARSRPRSAAERAAVAAAVLIAAALGGCGFQLEGVDALPEQMARTYLDTTDPSSEFFASLREALRLRGTEVVATREEALAVLRIIEDSTDQRVMSVTARNVPREYEIFYAVTFAVEAGSQPLIEPQSMVATRVYAWNENEVLGKAAEERILRRALADDLARRVLRRIEASRRNPASSPPS